MKTLGTKDLPTFIPLIETDHVEVYMAQNLIFDDSTSDDFELKFTRATYTELGLYSINYIKGSHTVIWVVVGVVICGCLSVFGYCFSDLYVKYRNDHGGKKFY